MVLEKRIKPNIKIAGVVMLKKFVIVITCVMFFSSLYADTNENNFWVSYLKENYKIAGDTAKELGKNNNQYYMLASACYYLIDDYSLSHLTKIAYNQNNNSNLIALLNNKIKENKTNYQIYILLGIIKKSLPEIDLDDAEIYFKKPGNLG